MSARLLGGVLGGIGGGIVFGILMHTMEMLEMVASLVGQESAAAGWGVHLVISVVIGVGFALICGALRPGSGAAIVYGLVYGAVWWVLGPLVLMPAMLGMGAFPPIEQPQLMSLVGHLVYGLVLAGVYVAVSRRAATDAAATSRRDSSYMRG